jgi:hypothetical protein
VSDIPAYSEAGIDVLDIFYQDYVAAIFFFEDEHHQAVYERLLMRLLPRLRSFQVICLGGKTKLIAKAKEVRPKGTKWLFVLDKDFDDLLGNVFVYNDVYYLRAFSLENYLADPNGIIRLAVEMNPRVLTVRAATERCASFQAYFARLCASLERIGRLFVVARRHRVNIQTTKLPVDELLKGADANSPIPTDEWYERYVAQFVSSLPRTAEWLAQAEMLQLEIDRAFRKDDRSTFPVVPAVDHLCGKHLLGCVLRALQFWLGVRILDLDVVELYTRLAGQVDLSRLEFLAQAIAKDHQDLIRA